MIAVLYEWFAVVGVGVEFKLQVPYIQLFRDASNNLFLTSGFVSSVFNDNDIASESRALRW